MVENICNIHNTKNINVYTLGNILKSIIKDQTPNVNKNGQKLWIGNSAKKKLNLNGELIIFMMLHFIYN